MPSCASSLASIFEKTDDDYRQRNYGDDVNPIEPRHEPKLAGLENPHNQFCPLLEDGGIDFHASFKTIL